MDTRGVRNTDSAGSKGYDPGKKVSGVKRHIAVDTQGLPHAIDVTTADVIDRAGHWRCFPGAGPRWTRCGRCWPTGLQRRAFCCGGAEGVGASVEVVKRKELHTFVVLPKRWVVERCFGWLDKCRRLWKNCERELNTSLQMVVLAFAVLILKRS